MPLEVKDLSYTHAAGTPFEQSALKGVSLKFEDGEYVGVMGRTGCGKTTLIQLMAGLLTPDSGQVLLDGEDISDRSYDRAKLRRKVGVVFQYPEYQLFEQTVERDVAFGLRHSGLSKEETAENVRWALETMGFSFEDVRYKSPLGLSGGEKRRVAIAGVLAVRPRILILDEPTAGMDPLGRRDFLAVTDKLNGEGVAVIVVSHSADDVCEHARRVIVLSKGAVAMDGPTERVFREADALSGLGVGLSGPRELALLLQRRGLDIGADTVRYSQLLPRLIESLRGGEHL